MMTKEQKIEAYAMRLDGATLQEIADRFGVTKQWISKILPKDPAFPGKTAKCVYPSIKNWLTEHHISYGTFREMIGVSPLTLTRYLSGRSDPSKKVIDKILDITEMTYEEAFKEETENE